MPKLTKSTVDRVKAVTGRLFVRDDDLPGFGLGVLPSGHRSFIVQYRIAPGAACHDGAGRYKSDTWLRRPIGRAPALSSDGGCRIYVKRGHLLNRPPEPDTKCPDTRSRG